MSREEAIEIFKTEYGNVYYHDVEKDELHGFLLGSHVDFGRACNALRELVKAYFSHIKGEKEKKINKLREEISKITNNIELSSYNKQKEKERLNGEIESIEKQLTGNKASWDSNLSRIDTMVQKTAPYREKAYGWCAQVHHWIGAYSNRAAYHFDMGNIIECFADLKVVYSKSDEKDPRIEMIEGEAYLEGGLYAEAIRALSSVLKKDPENKEAYFARAQAYFENGNFDLALLDYLKTGYSPEFIDYENPAHNGYLYASLGMMKGLALGGKDGVINFVPLLWHTANGLSTQLWALIQDPVGISRQFIDSVNNMIDYLRANTPLEMLDKIVPELRECLEKWNEWDDEKQGYMVGYLVGRYGVDLFMWRGCGRVLELARGLKKANTVMNLETMAKRTGEVEKLAAEFSETAKAFRAKCKIHWDKQNKHIRNAHNFEVTKGEITIPSEKLEGFFKKGIGTGQSVYGNLGDAGYKERVIFKETIGKFVTKENGEIVSMSTNVAICHYAKDGFFHVVPARPTI